MGDLDASVLGPDEARGDTVRELFRFAHNLKGMSAMEGIGELNRLAHASEDLLDRYRSGGQRPTTDEIEVLLAAADAMSDLVDELASGEPLTDHADLVAQLVELAGSGAAAPGSAAGPVAAAAGDRRPPGSPARRHRPRPQPCCT